MNATISARPTFGTVCLSMLIATSVPVYAQTPASAAVDLNYRVDAALIYLVPLGRPDAAVINMPAPSVVKTPRTIGLKKLRLEAAWLSASGAELGLTLRPDAMNLPTTESGKHREVDTRSGTPYRAEATVRLLDAYHLTAAVGAGLTASVGVFPDLAPARASYLPTADFGLAVRFPQKFSALKLRWQRQSAAPDLAVDAMPANVTTDVFVLQGNEDRVETYDRGKDLFDEAPVAADPYQGGGIYVGYTPSRRGELGLLAGVCDGAEIGGRRSEVFGQLIGSLTYPVLTRQGKLTLDMRYANEKWRGDGVDFKPRDQQSVSLTNAAGVTRNSFWLLGAHWGNSERMLTPSSDVLATQTGYQVETGWLTELNDGMSMQFLATHERREQDDENGGSAPGFSNAAGDERKTLRRFGLELSYALNENG